MLSSIQLRSQQKEAGLLVLQPVPPVQTTLICGEAQVCDCSYVWLLWSVTSLICYCFVGWLLRCVGKGVFCRQDNTSFASISKSTVVKPESSCIYQLRSSRIETRGENPRSGQKRRSVTHRALKRRPEVTKESTDLYSSERETKFCKHFQFLDFLQRNFPNEHECEVASAFFTFDSQIIFGDYSAVCKERDNRLNLQLFLKKIMHCLFNAWFPGTLKPIFICEPFPQPVMLAKCILLIQCTCVHVYMWH